MRGRKCWLALQLFGFLSGGFGFMACGESGVEQVGSTDKPCLPYEDNVYHGTYVFSGAELTLSVASAGGMCCAVIGDALIYEIQAITETTLVMALEGEVETTWSRDAGTAGDIAGSWTHEDGQALDLGRDLSFSGSDHPECFEPLPCGSVLPGPGDGVSPFMSFILLLPFVFALGLKFRARNGLSGPRGGQTSR